MNHLMVVELLIAVHDQMIYPMIHKHLHLYQYLFLDYLNALNIFQPKQFFDKISFQQEKRSLNYLFGIIKITLMTPARIDYLHICCLFNPILIDTIG